MQCDAIECDALVLDTTGPTYARQQPRYIEREKTEDDKQRKKKKKEKKETKKYPEK